MLKRLCGVLLVFALVASSALPAAAWAPSKILAAAARMQELGILRGRPGEGMAYQETLTRAEAVTIVVRALGREGEALRATTPAFDDTADHWANGYIKVAQQIAIGYLHTLGYPDGTFRPDDPVTPNEIVALVLKLLGVPPEPGYDWPDSYFKAGVRTGMIDGDNDRFCGAGPDYEPAIRGCIFQYADRAFTLVPINEKGESVYEHYHNLKVELFAVDGAKEKGNYFKEINSRVMLTGWVDLTGTVQVKVNNGKFRTIKLNPKGGWEHLVSLKIGKNTVTFKVSLPNGREETHTLTMEYGRP